jgi:hypothetical protein
VGVVSVIAGVVGAIIVFVSVLVTVLVIVSVLNSVIVVNSVSVTVLVVVGPGIFRLLGKPYANEARIAAPSIIPEKTPLRNSLLRSC